MGKMRGAGECTPLCSVRGHGEEFRRDVSNHTSSNKLFFEITLREPQGDMVF